MPARRESSSLSRSMANLDFDPEQGKRRARAQRSKRDMGQSCSAFHFVLDKSEMAEARAAGDDAGKIKSKRSSSKDRGTADPNRPSYSDLVMDVTSKSPKLDLLAGSPTSVMAEEGKSQARRPSDTTHTSNDSNISSNSPGSSGKEAAKESTSASSSGGRKPARTMPSSTDFITRNRVTRTRSNMDSSHGSADPLQPGGRARLNRKASRDNQFSMSMDADFPEPSELTLSNTKSTTDAFLAKQKSAHRNLSKSPPSRKKGNSNNANQMSRFSKSFSGFDDWDHTKDLDDAAGRSTTPPTKRRGKKPVRPSITADDLHRSADNHNHNSLSNLEASLTELDLLSDNVITSQNSEDQSNVAVVEKKVGRKSFHDKNVNGNRPPSTRNNPRQTRNNAGGRFAQSFSSFEVSPCDLVSTSVSPTPIISTTTGDADVASRPRRSSRIVDPEELLAKEATIEVEKQKVSSLEEFQKSWSGDVDDQILFDDESHTITSKPPTTRKAPRSKREPNRGVTRMGSSSRQRVRRCKTDDASGLKAARSSHEPVGRRRGNKDPEMQKHRSVSRDRKSRRASISVIAMEKGADSPPPNRRASRRSIAVAVEDDGDDTPPKRRTPRRTRSSDGSTPMDRSSRNRTGVRRTMSTDGSTKPSPSLHKSLSSRRADSGKRRSRSPPAPRRKTPQRSKSHGGGVGTMDASRNVSRERGESGTTMDEKSSRRRPSVTAINRAERRAMAHNIIEG